MEEPITPFVFGVECLRIFGVLRGNAEDRDAEFQYVELITSYLSDISLQVCLHEQ
jgi:hypothetical protein